MSNSRRALLLGAALASALLAGPVSAETLQDAIALAYQTNPTLQQQRAQQRVLDEGAVQARAGLRPEVDVGLSVSGSDGGQQTDFFGGRSTNANTTFSYTGQIGVGQTLYAGGRVARAVQAADADILQGREQLRSVEADVLQAVVQAFVDVRRDQEALRIRQDNVQVLRRQLDEASARFEVGEITRTDVAQAEARLSQSESLLANAQAQLSVSRAAYAAVVGQAPGTLAAEPDLPGLPATFEAALDVAEDANPELRAAQFAEQAARARVAQARAAYMPSARLSASYGAGGAGTTDSRFFQDQFFDKDEARATLSFSQPLFTGGLNGSRLRQALERQNAAQIAVEGQRRNVLQAVSQSWASLSAARASVVANEEAVRAQRIAAEGVRQEAQVGLRTTLDVLDAERELREAELALVNSRRNAYVAQAQLLNAMGLLEAPRLVPDVEAYDPARNYERVRSRGSVFIDQLLERVDAVAAPPIPASRDTVADAPIDVQLKQGVRPDVQVPVTKPTPSRTGANAPVLLPPAGAPTPRG
jgi:outer membrane protein